MNDVLQDVRFWACLTAALIMIGGFIVVRIAMRQMAYQSLRRRYDQLTTDLITVENEMELLFLEQKVEWFRQDVLEQDIPKALELHRLLVRLIDKKKATS